MPASFWNEWTTMDDANRKVALFMVILKTYKILFDLHVNVTMRRWNSASRSVDRSDLMMEFNEISSKDEFVDSWTENTKKKVAAAYLSILRKREKCLMTTTSSTQFIVPTMISISPMEKLGF